MNLPNKLVLKAVISCSMSPFLYAKTSTRQEVMRNQDLNLGVQYTSNLKSEMD